MAGRPATIGSAFPNPPAGIALIVSGMFIALIYSRLVEILAIPGLTLVLGTIPLIYALATSRWSEWTRATPTLLLLGLTVWMLPCTALGLWPGGSARGLVNNWSRNLIYYLLIVCLAREFRSIRAIMSSLAWGTGIIVVLGITRTAYTRGRLSLEGGTLGNANDLAIYLLFGLPFALWYVWQRGNRWVLRLVLAGVVLGALVLALRTGSRMGLLALCGMAVALMVMLRGKARIGLVLAIGLALLSSTFVVPSEIAQRYWTILSRDTQAEAEVNVDVGAAISSAEGRWQLLKSSLNVTLRHPLFGVGPGNFTGANAARDIEMGERGNWLQSHNAYTQLSSECGIPGGALFLSLVLYCLLRSRQLLRASRTAAVLRLYEPMALCLLLSGVAFSICAVFGSIGYGPHLPILAALVMSVSQAFARVLKAQAISTPPHS